MLGSVLNFCPTGSNSLDARWNISDDARDDDDEEPDRDDDDDRADEDDMQTDPWIEGGITITIIMITLSAFPPCETQIFVITEVGPSWPTAWTRTAS